jgi:hypothetical protein
MFYLYKSIYLTLKMLKYIKLANLKIDMNNIKEETKKINNGVHPCVLGYVSGTASQFGSVFINDASFVFFCYIKISDPLTSEFCLQASFIR